MDILTQKQLTLHCEVVQTMDRLNSVRSWPAVERIWKISVEILTQKQHMVHSEVLKGYGHTVKCDVCTGIGQNVEDSSGHSETETTDGTLWGTVRQCIYFRIQQWREWHIATDGTVWGTDRPLTEYTRGQWKKWHSTNIRYSVNYWETLGRLYNVRYLQGVDRLYKTALDKSTPYEQPVKC